MSTYVLVHGAFLGAWCWKFLKEELTALGHQIIAPDLPLNDPDAGGDVYAKAVVQAIVAAKSEGVSVSESDLLLVGHSMGGLVIPVVHQSFPANRLVFLTAALPKPPKSFMERVRSTESDAFLTSGVINPFGDPECAKHYWFHDCSKELADWAAPQMRETASAKVIFEKCLVETLPSVKMTSIVGIREKLLNPTWSLRLSQELFEDEPITIESGHCPQVSRPKELAGILNSFAKNSV